MSEDMHEKEPVPSWINDLNNTKKMSEPMADSIASGFILREFQDSIARNIVYPTEDLKFELAYLSAGLNEEAGEASGKIKKYLRGDFPLELMELDEDLLQHIRPDYLLEREDHNKQVHQRRDQVALELGDALWYLTRLAHRLGYPLEKIMAMNMQKLQARKRKGTIQGEGDNR